MAYPMVSNVAPSFLSFRLPFCMSATIRVPQLSSSSSSASTTSTRYWGLVQNVSETPTIIHHRQCHWNSHSGHVTLSWYYDENVVFKIFWISSKRARGTWDGEWCDVWGKTKNKMARHSKNIIKTPCINIMRWDATDGTKYEMLLWMSPEVGHNSTRWQGDWLSKSHRHNTTST